MTFELQRFVRQTEAFNSGAQVVDTGIVNGPALYTYESATDTIAQIGTAGYFDSEWRSLCLGDFFICTGSDASNMFIVDAIDQTTHVVTLASFSASGSIGTANIQDLAVTTAKIDNLAVTTGKIAANAVTSAKLAATTVQYAAVPITASQFNGMYAAPVQLVAAAGANTLLVLDRVELAMTYNSAAYAAGGVAAVQYDSTANGAGVIASTTNAAASFQAAASTSFAFNQGAVLKPFTTCVNKGLYLSNITGAFTTGDSDFVAHVWYKVIPTA